jgi:hypothetical protein
MLMVATLLVSGIVGGLLRAGVALPLPAASAWPGQAVLAHAFLMICAFLGTAIGLERAVAAKARVAFAAPVAAAAAGIAALTGAPSLAAWLAVAAALMFLLVNLSMYLRQPAPHIGVLVAGAAAWWIGTLLFAWSPVQGAAAIPWWFSFLILTIAGERLEMTRLMRRRSGATASLYAALSGLLAGSALFSISPAIGAGVFGLALLGLAAWLVTFDIARRTIAANGLSRYMAAALLLGYVWLAVAGAAWIATAAGWPTRDLALHALGLGFVFSMMMAHAPVILPALTRIKVLFGWHFYLPLALLHGSLALRVAGPLDLQFLGVGASGNAIAIAAFLLTLLASAVAWRVKNPVPQHHVTAHHR